jgi:hypothetical protein
MDRETDTEMERNDNHLRVMIETMQREGRREHEIVAAVLEGSGRLRQASNRPSRHLVRFALPRRVRRAVGASH